MMDERIMHLLEFDKIIQQLKTHAETTLGKDECDHIEPSPDIETVKRWQSETDEAMQVERLNKTIPLGGVTDIRAGLKRTVMGGILSAAECLDIANTLYASRRASASMEQLEEPLPFLRELADRIVVLNTLEKNIYHCIDDHGNMLDSASTQLKSIRSSIRTYESRVREKLDSLTKTKSNMLSEAIVTIKNDRYVLPVKQEHRQTFGGIVHDSSASGQTLFMEPSALVDLNNQLHEARLKEETEIKRILQALSEQIASDYASISENVTVLGKIDFIFARAKLGMQMKASMPRLNANGIINMQQARHPLISKEEVVANDVTIGDDYTTIVITGPNTGGKTVALKLIGICTLMAQSGLQVPAMDGCEMAVFHDIFADIGDEQSIEQNLSTFSSHMSQIIDIIPQVNHQSLVLFDELGAGTDPQEGASLAMSLLDTCIQKGARVVATTHYPELKAYGYNRESVINASVEFDVETLEPTYRLLIGVPGKSNALEIAKRLGLPETIIQDARGHIGVESNSVENMISSLQEARKQAEKEYDEAHDVLSAAEKLHKDIQNAWSDFTNKRERLYAKAEEKADKALKKARHEAEDIVRDIRQMRDNAGMKEHEWIEVKKRLDELSPQLTTDSKDNERTVDNEQQTYSPDNIQVGDEIKLLTLDQAGTVAEQLNDNEFLVQIGAMKVKAKQDNLQLIKHKETTSPKPVTTVDAFHTAVKPELDLRGERYEEAMIQLERYMDDVLLAGYPQVTIIHGKGTGALRDGVVEYARNQPYIQTFRAGGKNEGGSGVTVLELQS